MATKTRKVESKPSSIIVTMTLEKETKNTYRYTATDEDVAIETLYVQKTAFASAPEAVTVTLSF